MLMTGDSGGAPHLARSTDPLRGTCLLLLIAISIGTTACKESTSVAAGDTTRPTLSVAPVPESALSDFLPFGWLLDATRRSPAYEYYTLSPSTDVYAASAGKVEAMLSNSAEQTDFEFHIRPSAQSVYLFIYDHITSPLVSVGETVTPGQTLGRVAPFNDAAVGRNGRTELQVNRGDGSSAIAICPRDFGTPAFNDAHDAALARFPARGTTPCLASTVVP